MILTIQGCGASETPETDREPAGPRSRGPQVDMEAMLEDPKVAAFGNEAAGYRELMSELRTLDALMVESGLSEAERERWNELERQATLERNGLNSMIYAADVDSDQRAAMWWLMQPESANPADG